MPATAIQTQEKFISYTYLRWLDVIMRREVWHIYEMCNDYPEELIAVEYRNPAIVERAYHVT